MLKTRLLTAGLLIPLVVMAVLMLPTVLLSGLIAFAIFLAAWEWLQLIGVEGNVAKVLIDGIIVLSAILVTYYLPANFLFAVATITWLLALLLVSVFANQPMSPVLKQLFHLRPINLLIALILFSCFVFSSVFIHQSGTFGPALLLFVMVTVWLADTGGYFAGKRFGKYKLASAISPNKTREGVAGAVVLSSLWSVAFYYVTDAVDISVCMWLSVNLIVVLLSIVGDLFESVFKRNFDVKDSGNLLPGHGGVLDRMDSLLAAVPVFAVVMKILGAL